jgi:hypothetical protein
MKMGIWNKAALILFLLADFISLAVLKVRSILADEAGTHITSLAMGANAGNLCSFNFQYCNELMTNETPLLHLLQAVTLDKHQVPLKPC